jgi:hypothetical protein
VVDDGYDFRDHVPELGEVFEELARQFSKWGVQRHDNFKWSAILGEEYGEACEAALDHTDDLLYAELIQVAAVAVNYACCVRLRDEPSNQPPDV